MLKVTLALFSLLFILGCSDSKKAAQRPAPKVLTYTTKAESVPIMAEFIGQIYGAEDIAIRARVEGFIKSIYFKEGTLVKEGDKLYNLESLTQEANVAEQQGKVASAEANLTERKNFLDRVKPLVEMDAVSQSDLDAAQADYKSAQSQLKAAKASLSSSKVNLSYTTLYSPITGVIGRSEFVVGDLVGSSGDNVVLNAVSSIDSVRVQFFISENLYLRGARNFVDNTNENMARPKALKTLQLFLSDGSRYRHDGVLNFIDRNIDPTTGAILVQGTFPNPEGILRPGLFAKISFKLRDAKDAILIPQRSVTELQELYQIAVIKDSITEIRTVEMGNKVSNFWIVEKGLTAGEKVVYEGVQKVRDSLKVTPIDTAVVRIKALGEEKDNN